MWKLKKKRQQSLLWCTVFLSSLLLLVLQIYFTLLVDTFFFGYYLLCVVQSQLNYVKWKKRHPNRTAFKKSIEYFVEIFINDSKLLFLVISECPFSIFGCFERLESSKLSLNDKKVASHKEATPKFVELT